MKGDTPLEKFVHWFPHLDYLMEAKWNSVAKALAGLFVAAAIFIVLFTLFM